MLNPQDLKVTFILKKSRNQSDCGYINCVTFLLFKLLLQQALDVGLILGRASTNHGQNH